MPVWIDPVLKSRWTLRKVAFHYQKATNSMVMAHPPSECTVMTQTGMLCCMDVSN